MRARPFTLRQATPADADWLGPRLRESDRIEVLSNFPDVTEAIRRSIWLSAICAVAEIDGEPVFVIGCAAETSQKGVGVPWLVATEKVAAYPGALTKITKHYIGLFLERWPVLLNYVDKRNTVSVRWLRRLGFQIGEPIAFGIADEPFHPFVMRS